MSNVRIRNMFLLVTALAVMFLLACGSSEPEVPQVTAVPVATATSLTGQEAIGLVQQWLSTQTYTYRGTTTKCPTNAFAPDKPWTFSYSSGIWTVEKDYNVGLLKRSWKVYDKTWVVVSNNRAC